MKRHLFHLFFIAIFIPTLYLFVGLRSSQSSIPSFQFNDQALNQFGWKENEEKDYQLTHLFPLPNQPYVYCEFRTSLTQPNRAHGSRHIGFLINIEKHERVFRIVWENIYQGQEERNIRHLLLSFFDLEDQPAIATFMSLIRRPEWVRQWRSRAFYPLLRSIFFKHSNHFFIHRGNQQYTIENFYPLPTYSRMNPYPNVVLGSEEEDGRMKEFTLDSKGRLTIADEWAGSRLPELCYPVGEQDYIGYHSENEKIMYFQREGNDRYHEYDVMDIMSLDSTFPASSVPPRSLSLIPAGTNSTPMLSFVILKSFNVFQFHPPENEKTQAENVFSLVRKQGGGYPLMTLKENQIMVLTLESPENSNFPYQPLNGNHSLYYVVRNDSKQVAFQGEEIPIQFTQPPVAFCRIPFDDEHILFYRDQHLWKKHWQSGQETPIFPQDDK